MSRRWRLTRRAETSLAEIARWTVVTFGQRRAEAYRDDLIDSCRAIADRTTTTRSCRALVDRPDVTDLRFCRTGQHFVIFVEKSHDVVILDFLHARSDLPRKLALISSRRKG